MFPKGCKNYNKPNKNHYIFLDFYRFDKYDLRHKASVGGHGDGFKLIIIFFDWNKEITKELINKPRRRNSCF